MNETASYLLKNHDGPVVSVYPGAGFHGLTDATACNYALDSDGRVISTVLETNADEPIDEVCDFFRQQVLLAADPSPKMKEFGIRRCYGDVLIVRLALDAVPDWQKDIILERLNESMNVIGTYRRTWSEDDEEFDP